MTRTMKMTVMIMDDDGASVIWYLSCLSCHHCFYWPSLSWPLSLLLLNLDTIFRQAGSKGLCCSISFKVEDHPVFVHPGSTCNDQDNEDDSDGHGWGWCLCHWISFLSLLPPTLLLVLTFSLLASVSLATQPWYYFQAGSLQGRCCWLVAQKGHHERFSATSVNSKGRRAIFHLLLLQEELSTW